MSSHRHRLHALVPAAIAVLVGLPSVADSATSTTSALTAQAQRSADAAAVAAASAATRRGGGPPATVRKGQAPAVTPALHHAKARHSESRRANPLIGATPALPAPSQLGALATVAVNARNDHQYVYWRSTGGRIYEAYETGSWHGPLSRGWSAASTPSAAVDNVGHEFVVWQGAGGDIYEATYIRSWSHPVDLSRSHGWGPNGRTDTSPAVAVNPGDDHPRVYWRAGNGLIYESGAAGGWRRPVTQGWRSASAPSAAITAAGHQFVFWTATNGDIDEAWNYSRWSTVRDLSQDLHWNPPASSAPAAAVNAGNGHQYVFWRGTDGRVYEAWDTGRWHGPSTQGWLAASAPAAAVSGDGHQYVLWGQGGRLWEGSRIDAWTGTVGRWWLTPTSGAYVEVLETNSRLSQTLSPQSDVRFSGSTSGLPTITVNDRQRFQRVTGVGAAMTDTSAWLIHDHLSPSTRSSLMRNLYTTDGIHMSFTLTPMGGPDFSVAGRPYTYDDLGPGHTDPTLARFTTVHDQAYILPVLRQMLAIAPRTETFAVPWSPPAWMKANDQLNDLDLKGTLLAAAYQPLADYFVKYLQSYGEQGVPIDAIAPENEPRAGSAFPAMYFPATGEGQWLTKNLVPALAAAGLHPEVFGNDTSWGVESYAQSLTGGPARKVMHGLAWHCYSGIPPVMTDLHRQAPRLEQIVTECAPNLTRFAVPEILIGAIRNWASTVTLWNVATDPSGGPVQAPNSGCHGCRGLVTINERTRGLTYNPDYYELGQMGAFLQAGATRIESNHFVSYQRTTSSYGVTPGLDDVALSNPDGSKVLVVYNNANSTRRFAVSWHGRAFTYTLTPNATVSFRWTS